MGNSISRGEGLTRGGSKRFSRRNPKAKHEKQENPKKMDESEMKSHQPLEEKRDNMEKYLNTLQEQISRHGDNLDHLVKARKPLTGKIDDVVKILNDNVNKSDAEASPEGMIEVQADTMKKAVAILGDVQKQINVNINPLENSFKDVSHDIDICRDRFKKDFTDTQHNMHVLEQLQKDLDNCYYERRKLEKQVKRLKQLVEKEEKTLDSEIMQPAYVPAKVQLFYTHGGYAIKAVEDELITMLKHRLGPTIFVNCRNVSDIDEEKLLIVLCVVMTRLRADAANAIKDIKNPGNTALLIIHLTQTHSLTNLQSSRHLTDQQFENLRGIFDMIFMSGNGFLQCNMNERSIKEICSFCKQQPLGERL